MHVTSVAVSYQNQSLYLSGLEVKGTGLQSKLYTRSQKHKYKCQHWSLNSFCCSSKGHGLKSPPSPPEYEAKQYTTCHCVLFDILGGDGSPGDVT